jgi:hypothetical protein
MTTTTYSVRVAGFGEVFRFRGDLSELSAPLLIVDDGGSTQSTPYQTADARRDMQQAARLLARWMESESGEPYIKAGDTVDVVPLADAGISIEHG